MKSSEFNAKVIPLTSRLYRLAYSMLSNREEAEDTVQEVFVKMWGMRSELKRYDSLEGLAVRITRNQCLDILRRRQTTRTIEKKEAYEQEGVQEDPSVQLEGNERRKVLLKLIEELPEPQRSLVYFRHIEGKEYKEMEALMNMKENAMRVSISRARKQMRSTLEKKYTSWTH